MTKDRGGWKRSLKLMAVGGTMLGMFWFPSISWESWGGLPSGGGLPGWGCGDNANFVTYFNTLGTTAISDISDRYFDDQVVNSDYDKFVRGPTTTLMQNLWTDWTTLWFPRDP